MSADYAEGFVKLSDRDEIGVGVFVVGSWGTLPGTAGRRPLPGEPWLRVEANPSKWKADHGDQGLTAGLTGKCPSRPQMGRARGYPRPRASRGRYWNRGKEDS